MENRRDGKGRTFLSGLKSDVTGPQHLRRSRLLKVRVRVGRQVKKQRSIHDHFHSMGNSRPVSDMYRW